MQPNGISIFPHIPVHRDPTPFVPYPAHSPASMNKHDIMAMQCRNEALIVNSRSEVRVVVFVCLINMIVIK